MQRCKQSGLLPAGTEVQVLQPCILQTDVLQDLPGALTLGAQERYAASKRERERKARKMEGGSYGTERERRWKQGRLKKKQKKPQTSGPVETDEIIAGERSSKDFPVYHTWSSSPPSWWNPNHCSAHNADTNLVLLIFHFCEVELGRLFVGDVIFIIIIIINIIVNLPSCLLFNESKVLDTSLTEDVPRRWTDRWEDSSPEEGGRGVERVGLLSLRWLWWCYWQADFWLRCTFSCKYFATQIGQRTPISVLYIYCTIPNNWDIVLWSCLSDSSLLSWKGM